MQAKRTLKNPYTEVVSVVGRSDGVIEVTVVMVAPPPVVLRTAEVPEEAVRQAVSAVQIQDLKRLQKSSSPATHGSTGR